MVQASKDSNFQFFKAGGLSVERFPETEQEADIAENLLAKELEKLSLDEHEKILFDVHGICQDFDEEPQMVETKLKELDIELERISEKRAYDLAKQWKPDYVSSRSFRLMFLRCKLFDVKTTTEMIVEHFEVKRHLFGDGEVLGRDVRQSDLTAQDRTVLESGYAQVLPCRDAAGRTILCISSNAISNHAAQHEYRSLWYMCMVAARDEETQKKGCVWLLMHFNSYKTTASSFQGSTSIESAVPTRSVGGHYCYTDPELRRTLAGCKMLVREEERFRLREHFGTRETIDFELQTFGIPVEHAPLKKDGSFKVQPHLERLSTLRVQEARLQVKDLESNEQMNPVDNESTIVIPRRFDVLCGKSQSAITHTGTMRALHLVEMHFEAYEKLGRYQKSDVAERIISIIHESGGRFVKHDDDGAWIETTDQEARKKVAHWFRHVRSKRSLPNARPKDGSTETKQVLRPKRVISCASPVEPLCRNEGIGAPNFHQSSQR